MITIIIVLINTQYLDTKLCRYITKNIGNKNYFENN